MIEATARPSEGVAGNQRLTASTAVVLFVLLAAEGVTLLARRELLGVHVFIGALLIPPVLLKVGSTCYRFARYYWHAPAYVLRGPPPALLRVLGPGVVVLTLVLLASGVAVLFAGPATHRVLLTVHHGVFLIWFAAMTVHVLGHLWEMLQHGFGDWTRAGVSEVAGARQRTALLLVTLSVGVALGVLVLGCVGPYLTSLPQHFEQ